MKEGRLGIFSTADQEMRGCQHRAVEMWKALLHKVYKTARDQLGGAEKSVKDDARFLVGEVPFDQLPMAAGADMRMRETKVPFGSWNTPNPDSRSHVQRQS